MGAWPYPPWLVSCNERSVFVPEWTTPQLSSMCLTLSPMVSLMYRAKCIHPRVNNSPKCIAPKLTTTCLTLSPLVSLMYRAKCINPRVNNSPKWTTQPTSQFHLWHFRTPSLTSLYPVLSKNIALLKVSDVSSFTVFVYTMSLCICVCAFACQTPGKVLLGEIVNNWGGNYL